MIGLIVGYRSNVHVGRMFNDGDDVGTMFKLNDVVAKMMETIFDGDEEQC